MWHYYHLPILINCIYKSMKKNGQKFKTLRTKVLFPQVHFPWERNRCLLVKDLKTQTAFYTKINGYKLVPRPKVAFPVPLVQILLSAPGFLLFCCYSHLWSNTNSHSGEQTWMKTNLLWRSTFRKWIIQSGLPWSWHSHKLGEGTWTQWVFRDCFFSWSIF